MIPDNPSGGLVPAGSDGPCGRLVPNTPVCRDAIQCGGPGSISAAGPVPDGVISELEASRPIRIIHIGSPREEPYTHEQLMNRKPNPAWRNAEYGEVTGGFWLPLRVIRMETSSWRRQRSPSDHRIIGRHHNHGYIRNLGTSCTHRCKGFVTRRI